MRITSIFISTLLSALTVLVQGADQYAGFRLPARLGQNFKEVSTNFNVPTFECGPENVIAYLGVGIGGPPLACPGDGGIEAGVILECQEGQVIYRPYWRTYPDTAHFGRHFRITPANRVRVEVKVDPQTGVVSVTINGRGNDFEPSRLGTVVQACTTTAGWWLRAAVLVDGTLTFPLFQPITMEHVQAINFQGIPYGLSNAEKEVIKGPRRFIVVKATKYPNSNPNSVIISRR